MWLQYEGSNSFLQIWIKWAMTSGQIGIRSPRLKEPPLFFINIATVQLVYKTVVSFHIEEMFYGEIL